MVHASVTDLIERVIGSGLFSVSDDSYFTHDGCDYCSPAVGNTVFDVRGYTSLEQAHGGEDNEHDFHICGECLNRLYYGN